MHLLLIPLADWLEEPAFCRNYSIDRTMILIGLKIRIHRCGVVQDLDLLTAVRSIAIERGMNAQAIVGARSKLEFKLENEIRILFCRVKIAMTFTCWIDSDGIV